MILLEVETKVKLDSKEVPELRKKIQKIAKLDKKEKRADDYFALKKKIRKHGYPKKAFRIRHDGKKYVINFKNWLTKYWDKQVVVKREFEFETENPKEFLALMFDLGFKQWLKKFKTTESYLYKKDKRIIIEINHVKHLGYFMEMEYIAKPGEMNKAKKKIKQVLKELEIKQSQIHNIGYTRMLWDKGIRDKKHWVD
jgi:predicted adenylyl cyclase CyaB